MICYKNIIDIASLFKNYFDTVFLVFSFSNNKFNPNEPLKKI